VYSLDLQVAVQQMGTEEVLRVPSTIVVTSQDLYSFPLLALNSFL
jgi:hypothetical protein